MAEQILIMIHGIAATAAKLGFYLHCWIQVVNVMIYKKPGCIELDKLRVIHLFKADLNLMIGILFGRRAMFHQVDHQLLNPAQFGRPGGECQDSSISKVLHNLVSSLTHTPMGQFESDATACFDREVMKFVLTCYHSTGPPLGPLHMWGKVLYNVVHKVKTGFGITNAGYSFTPDFPIYGPGQGSKGRPGSCSTMTSILIDGMPRLCHRLQFTDPAQSLEYTATVSMFVDDASNSTNKFREWLQDPPDLTTLVEMTRHDAQTWERFLWTSGGLRNLLKSAFYVIAWQFDAEGRAHYVDKQHIPNLRLTSGNNPATASVAQLNHDETHAYLGKRLATGMQMKDALATLTKTASTFAARLLCSNLSQRDTWVAYVAVFVPSMPYTLPISHHSAKSLVTLQSAPTRAAPMKIGFNRNAAKRVVYGPSRYGGLGFRDLFVE
jgi:hypothetical protein